MKKLFHLLIALLTLSLLLVACQASPAEQPTEDNSEPSAEQPAGADTAGIETAYPAEEGQAVQAPPDMDLAYRVTEEDLGLLQKTWEATQYLEDGMDQDPVVQTLQFNADGTYEMTTESGIKTGIWTARLSSLESLLILTDDAGVSQTHEIIELEENLLILQSWRETIQIEQQFQPVE